MRNREAMRKTTKILEFGKRASENLVLFLQENRTGSCPEKNKKHGKIK